MRLPLLVIFLFTGFMLRAQNSFFKPDYLKIDVDNPLKEQLLLSLDSLLSQIDRGKLDSIWVGR